MDNFFLILVIIWLCIPFLLKFGLFTVFILHDYFEL
jgi:hypothetical protein